MPNSAIVYSGFYEVDRLRRRRDRRVQEYIQYRSRRIYRPPPPITMCRIIKLALYFTIFFLVLAVLTGAMVILVMHFRIPPDKPAVTKIPGLCSVPGTPVGDLKRIVWGESLAKEIGAIRREIERHVDQFGVVGNLRMAGCNTDLFWGYDSGKPCILLKLTQTLGFNPVVYESALELPKNAPDDLFYHVISRPWDQRTNRIWVACGVNNKKSKDLNVRIKYIPHRHFETHELFTPYNASEHGADGGVYKNPGVKRFIAVQVSDIPPNRNIYISCQVWAKNIPLHMASAKFELRLMAPVPKKAKILHKCKD